MHRRRAEILLVEDNRAEARLAREAFADAHVQSNLSVARDGVEALNFLRRAGAGYAHAPRPDLVLLDFNLPRKDGREVLRQIKIDDDLRAIPVVVLTTSKARDDVLIAYDLQANCYITKPMDLEGFITVVKAIDAFWLQLAELPTCR